jgi:hypothetical protein
MTTIQALKLALEVVCDIVVDTDSETLRAINYRLTDSDRQRVLKLAYLYTLEYRPRLTVV